MKIAEGDHTTIGGKVSYAHFSVGVGQILPQRRDFLRERRELKPLEYWVDLRFFAKWQVCLAIFRVYPHKNTKIYGATLETQILFPSKKKKKKKNKNHENNNYLGNFFGYG
jgi:hypothetical protein